MQAPQVGSRLLVAENADFCQAALPPGVDEVWCEFNVVEAESRGDFLITPSRASGPHKPLDGRAVSVFDSAPEATPANGTYLAPGSSVLLPVAGSGMSVSHPRQSVWLSITLLALHTSCQPLANAITAQAAAAINAHRTLRRAFS